MGKIVSSGILNHQHCTDKQLTLMLQVCLTTALCSQKITLKTMKRMNLSINLIWVAIVNLTSSKKNKKKNHNNNYNRLSVASIFKIRQTKKNPASLFLAQATSVKHSRNSQLAFQRLFHLSPQPPTGPLPPRLLPQTQTPTPLPPSPMRKSAEIASHQTPAILRKIYPYVRTPAKLESVSFHRDIVPIFMGLNVISVADPAFILMIPSNSANTAMTA